MTLAYNAVLAGAGNRCGSARARSVLSLTAPAVGRAGKTALPKNDLLPGLGRSTPENVPAGVGRQAAVRVVATVGLIVVAVTAVFGLVVFGLWAVRGAA
ncbi:hypothetical protein GCM10022223_05560 [Kineosporia mesophila]|uniref:Uncharacterized protein n=1 Tax=Kineosporia mesophila TaxID=566012 RepID=A0ABP6YZK5_9ACTN